MGTGAAGINLKSTNTVLSQCCWDSAPGQQVVNVHHKAKFISTRDEPGQCVVICKVMEFDGLVSGSAAVGVKGEEQGIKYRALRGTDADALKV